VNGCVGVGWLDGVNGCVGVGWLDGCVGVQVVGYCSAIDTKTRRKSSLLYS
jgi:hypothetical protein